MNLEEQLQQKEQDLLMAAEIGASLLQENQQLTDSLQAQQTRLDQLESSFGQLESDYAQLQSSYVSVKSEKEHLTTLNAQLQKQVQSLETRQQESEQEHATLLSRINVLEQEKERLMSERMDTSVQKDKQASVLGQRVEKLSKENQDMLDVLKQLQLDLMTKESKNQELMQENENLDAQVKQLQETITGLEDYPEECRKQQEWIEQLNVDLDHQRHINLQLQQQLEKQEVQPVKTKSLLGQVEEERQELESKNQILAQEHAHLAKQHQFTMQKQSKLQNHLQRLKQLTATEEMRHRVQMLESALAQSEAERHDLENRLLTMDSQRFIITGPGDAVSNIQLDQLKAEYKTLLDNYKTLRLVKQNETDKMMHLTRELSEKELVVEDLRRRLADAQFKLQDLQTPDPIEVSPSLPHSISSQEPAVVSQPSQDPAVVSLPSQDPAVVSLPDVPESVSVSQSDVQTAQEPAAVEQTAQQSQEETPLESKDNGIECQETAGQPTLKVDTDDTKIKRTDSNETLREQEFKKKTVLDRSKVQECNQQ